MATLSKETYRVTFKCVMQNENDGQESRNVSFDSFKNDTTELLVAARAIGASLVGSYNQFIQPSGWRDYDYSDMAYTTISVTPVVEHNIEMIDEEITPS